MKKTKKMDMTTRKDEEKQTPLPIRGIFVLGRMEGDDRNNHRYCSRERKVVVIAVVFVVVVWAGYHCRVDRYLEDFVSPLDLGIVVHRPRPLHCHPS